MGCQVPASIDQDFVPFVGPFALPFGSEMDFLKQNYAMKKIRKVEVRFHYFNYLSKSTQAPPADQMVSATGYAFS